MATEKVNIPEAAPQIATGDLSQLWAADSALPKFQGAEVFWYYLRRGFDNLVALPGSNAITILTIAVSLFLFAGFLLLLQNIDKEISGAGTTLYVTAYIKEGAPDKQVTSFIKELEQSPGVRSVRYLSKDDALTMFREELGSRASFLKDLESDNPLPASIELVLQPDELKIGRVGASIERLRENPLLEEVIYGNEWVERSQRVLNLFRFLGYLSLAVVLVIIIFLIANTIKLVIYARRDEIIIMQLVGATDSFVKMPFIISGVLQGLVGAGCGLLVLRIAFWIVNFQLVNSSLLGVALPQLTFLSVLLVFAVILLGMFIGAIGSFFALGRFMNY